MAKDYKHRVQKQKKPKQTVSWWKWLLVIMLIALFIAFLTFLRGSAPDSASKSQTLILEQPGKQKANNKKTPDNAKNASKPTGPRFDFYTILPEAEVVVPDHEVKTRTREERVNKSKTVQYILQAGSFRKYEEADKAKANLALMGIEATIEKAQVGNATWNRIKIGPFSKMSSVNKIRSRLKANKIDVVVMETSK